MNRPLARAVLVALGCATMPISVAAHPHVFVDTEVEIVFNDRGGVSGVRLTWIYDDFFSLLLTEELGLDPDGDMVLTEDELATLADFILDWPPEFGGDLQVTRADAPVALGPLSDGSVDLVDGRIRESHVRALTAATDTPPDAQTPVLVQVFDPYYYTAYDVLSVSVTGTAAAQDCAATLQKADLNAAYSLVDEVLYGRPASDVGPEEDFPEVGYAFADTVVVTCAASS